MKIACIASSQIPSSTANSIQVMKVCHALKRTGHEVCLWVPGSDDTSWATLMVHYGLIQQFDINWLPAQRLLKRYDMAVNALLQARNWGADIVYTWMPQAAALALMRHVPVLLEVHDLPTGHIGPRLFHQIVRSSGKKRLLPITQALYDRLKAQYTFDLPPEEVMIAPNGTDLDRYNNLPNPQEARRLLGLREGITVGYTGHFYSGRGMDLMIRLIALFPQVNFLFVGGQPEKVYNWQALTSQARLNNIHTTGFIENARLPMYQAAADILIMPYEEAISGSSGGNSAEICSPMKMFDYLAAGRAIITSDLPVLREVLHEKNAIFCPPNDVEAWKSALEQLIDNESLRENLGLQARSDAANYTWTQRARRALAGFEP
jgi:glycosyltransferase involved in cell wall biosynthesis